MPLKIPLVFAVLTCVFFPLFAQELMAPSESGSVVLMTADLAVLESREPRTDLPCVVTPLKPELGFDLKLHAGYRATLPFDEVHAGSDLLVIARVRQAGGRTVHLRQRLTVPP